MDPRKVYVASDFAMKAQAVEASQALWDAAAISNGARWNTTQPITLPGGLGGELPPKHAKAACEVAVQDMEDILEAGVFVQLTTGELCRGGRQVELGFALALAFRNPERRIVVLGPREHAFHYHPKCEHVEDLHGLALWARAYVKTQRRRATK
jgi:hypothetical protein